MSEQFPMRPIGRDLTRKYGLASEATARLGDPPLGGDFRCLTCGTTFTDVTADEIVMTVKCTNCGRDMYRTTVPGKSPHETIAGVPVVTALPTRYGGASSYIPPDDPDEGRNVAMLPHTPFVVILGFIFSLLPVICFAGLAISILGYRLVNESPQEIRGKGLAIAGIATASLMTVFTIILMISYRG